MKRVCVFAHWDKDSIIDDYVIYYLKALREVADTIIFVSDCNLEKNETSKLKDIADYCLAEKHGEYDFGSYKRGFMLAKEKDLIFDELIFANDSVYGPFYPLKPIFDKMGKKKCDWWGMTKNRYGMRKEDDYNKPVVVPHLQSYFLVFKKNIFLSEVFENFIKNIKKESNKQDIITNYEVGLSVLLKKYNYKYAVYINKYHYIHNCAAIKWNKLIQKENYPFLKTTIIKNGFYYTGKVDGWKELIRDSSNYPIELIEKHSERHLELYENQYEKANVYRKVRYNLLKNCPLEVRYAVICIEKAGYKILNAICFNKLNKF